ncbi:MAG: lipopolysaccharide core heptose(I) kinase RfaP [Porticoccus sp.]|uniref:lipopolysaccharide core heptose(I) kinase RfaP n=1 Tax=Porticoccus sp. TaxID=2024853 RepID=UPI003297FF69
MKLFLAEPFASRWRDSDPFEAAFSLTGELFRDMGDRRTTRFECEGAAYFVKTHAGIGIGELLKNLLYLRAPVLGAENEYRAISRLAELGVETMTAVAFGRRGWNPASEKSFLITRALEPTLPLDEYCNPQVLSAMGVSERRALVRRLARISRTLHDNGINHRDYYLCHFLLDTSPAMDTVAVSKRPLYLIDLHRVQIRHRTPRRWRHKDLAALFYSARRVGFDERDVACFLVEYKQQTLRTARDENRRLWQAVREDADQLHRKGIRKGYHT